MNQTTMITEKNIVFYKYKNYSAEKLIQDEYFIHSMINPTKESDAFWRKIIQEGILSSENFHLACYMFDSLQVHSEYISNEEIDFLWDNIKTTNHKLRKKKKNYFILWTFSCVASLLLFFISIQLISNSSEKHTAFMIESIPAPIEPVTDIQLILADNEAIAVDGKEADIIYDGENIAINNNDTKLNKKQTNNTETINYNQLIIPKGKRSTLTLEDGSKIWINASTRVVYPVAFAANEREIYVDGEVFLEVSHEEKQPFIVKSKDFNVEVLGTSFNFMAYESDHAHHVVLVSGSVKIKSKNNTETVLSPNEMYFMEDNTSHIQKVDVNDYISWKAGMYQYHSERMDNIMKRLSRYYGEEIICMPEIAHLKCSGKLDLKDNLSTVLKGISQTAPVNYRFENGKHIVNK